MIPSPGTLSAQLCPWGGLPQNPACFATRLHGQNRLAINLVRATPLLWKTVPSADLKGQIAHQEQGATLVRKTVRLA
jgi:hypothetical protein